MKKAKPGNSTDPESGRARLLFTLGACPEETPKLLRHSGLSYDKAMLLTLLTGMQHSRRNKGRRFYCEASTILWEVGTPEDEQLNDLHALKGMGLLEFRRARLRPGWYVKLDLDKVIDLLMLGQRSRRELFRK